jgi:AcrR family transcriptional regulator
MSHEVGGVALELLRGGGEAIAPHTPVASDRGPGRSGLVRSVPGPSAQRVRIVDAALRCITRRGVAKTTLDDVAREASCSRATVYRNFPGGKEAVVGAVVDTEVSRFFSALAVRMGEATTLEDALVAGVNEAAVRISGHRALARLMEEEPEVVLPHLAFSHMDIVLDTCAAFAAPFLGRWLDHSEARRLAEWAARIVLSYLACPAEGTDLTDPRGARHVVRTFVVPSIRSGRPSTSSSVPLKGEPS